MNRLISFLLLWCSVSFAGILPEPQSVEYGPVIRLQPERIRVTAPDVPAAKLALEFLCLPPFSGEAKLDLVLKCGTVNSENYTLDYDMERKRLVIEGEGPAGMFHGVMTLLQLIRRDGGKWEITLAKVKDGPVWGERYIGDYSPFGKEQLAFAAKYKYGGLAFQFRSEWHKFTGEKYAKIFAAQRNYLDAGVLKFMLVYHIYATTGKRERKLFNIADEEDLKGLVERCRFAYESGFRSIMICADDWTPLENGCYILTSPEEKCKFNGSAAAGHAYLMSWLKERLPQVRWSFCPPVYSIRHTVNAPPMIQYLKELGRMLPEDIPVVWTGPQVISSEITEEDHRIFSGYAGGHKTLIWDNSECNPYPIHRWETKIASSLASGGIFCNAHGFGGSPWQRWFAVTANEYFWNPAAYDADRTFTKIYGHFRPHYDVREVFAFQKRFDELNNMSPWDDFREQLAKLKRMDRCLQKKGLVNFWTRGQLDGLYAKLESPRPRMEVPLISRQPIIDGKTDDPCWRNVREREFVARNGAKTKDGRRTFVKAVFDREALYFAFRVEYDEPLFETASGHSLDLFRSSDLVELFLKPGERYLQAALDHRGFRFTSFFGTPSGFRTKHDWQGKVWKGQGQWTAEIRIPFALLSEIGAVPPSNRMTWNANFCREYNVGKELQCWSPAHSNSFLDPAMFGTLVFIED